MPLFLPLILGPLILVFTLHLRKGIVFGAHPPPLSFGFLAPELVALPTSYNLFFNPNAAP